MHSQSSFDLTDSEFRSVDRQILTQSRPTSAPKLLNPHSIEPRVRYVNPHGKARDAKEKRPNTRSGAP